MAIKYLSSINLNQNELQNAKIQNLATAPENAVKGQIFYNTTENKLQVYDGAEWVNVGKGADTAYELPTAAANRLGGILSGGDITVDETGIVTVNDNSHAHTIENVTGLQDALDAKLAKNSNITAGTATKVTYDEKGLITGSEELVASDIPDLSATYVNVNQKGVANGVATLDENGHVLTSQLPSYVDDVVEAANFAALPTTGEGSKIYVTLDNNKTYRWSGSAYVEISASLALGTTAGTAYEGSAGAQLRTDLDNLSATVAGLDGTYATDAELKAAKEGLEGTIGGIDTRVKALEDVDNATQAELDAAIAAERKASTEAVANAKAELVTVIEGLGGIYSIAGDGATTAFTITHDVANATVLLAQVYDANKNLVMVDTQIKSAKEVTITFGTAPAASETYSVAVFADYAQPAV